MFYINYCDYFLNENTEFCFLSIYVFFPVILNCVSDHSVKKMPMTPKIEKFHGSLYFLKTYTIQLLI
jgi:hypothetical protein